PTARRPGALDRRQRPPAASGVGAAPAAPRANDAAGAVDADGRSRARGRGQGAAPTTTGPGGAAGAQDADGGGGARAARPARAPVAPGPRAARRDPVAAAVGAPRTPEGRPRGRHPPARVPGG